MWAHHVGAPCGHTMWVHHVGAPCGHTMWVHTMWVHTMWVHCVGEAAQPQCKVTSVETGGNRRTGDEDLQDLVALRGHTCTHAYLSTHAH